MHKTFVKRPLCFLLSLVMIAGLYPFSILTAASATPTPFSAMGETKTADPSTMNDYIKYFNDTTTEYAGGVWTDKSVFTVASAFAANGISLNKQDDFLIALSAMASNMTIEGMEYSPTDTVLILDVSISMQNSSSGNYLSDEMVEAANQSIASLLSSGKHNRVSVIAFSDEEATVLLPLGRYTTAADGNYLSYTQTSGGGWGSSGNETITVDSDTRIEGTSNAPTSSSITVDGSTYTQLGVTKAVELFLAQAGNTTVNDPVLGTLKRTPVIVLMSDGEPTYATENFTSPKANNRFGTGIPGQSNVSSLAFVTQLTLAYAKTQINTVYGDSLIYTLGLGVGSNAAAKSVLDPVNSSTAINDFWTQYNAAAVGGTVQITASSSGGGYYPGGGGGSTSTRNITKIATALDKNYVEQYVQVDTGVGAGDALIAAFDNIVKQIQLKSKFYPTLVEGSEYLSGYVSFVDKLGKYMEVKDIKGLLINNVLHTGQNFAKHLITHYNTGNFSLDPNDICYEFIDSIVQRLNITPSEATTLASLAIANGQIAYDSTSNTFSNYIGWFSDANGNFVGFWHEGIANIPANATHINRSYGFFGDTDISHDIDQHDMLYATVRVREEIATGFESVAFAVPASLIPTLTYNVSLDENGNPTNIVTTGDRFPIRLVYEAGLEDEINEVTVQKLVTDAEYKKHHVDKETDYKEVGEYEFYTNRFDHGTNVTAYGTNNTYSYFTPSKENERYYYLSDSPVYSDQSGTLYKGDTAPSVSGTYYRAVTVYQKNGSSFAKNTIYEQIMTHAFSHMERKSDGVWYVKAGTSHNYVENREVTKSLNATNSIDYSYHPFVDSQNDYIVGAVLGNNGRLVVTPATGIKVTKEVTEVSTDPSAPTSFTFTVTNKTNTADSATYKTYHVAGGVITEGIISFTNGSASFSIKNGEMFYITGFAAGQTLTVTEAETEYYYCRQNNIELTTVSKSLVTAEFINTARGKGDLTVAKEIKHDFGTNYEIPADMVFDFEVTLEGVAGRAFDAMHSGDSTVKAVTVGADGKITFSLKNNEEFEIYGLPEGTKATVKEINTPAGFTAAYEENFVAGGDGSVVIPKNNVVVVDVVNTYKPDSVTVGTQIVVSGGKTFLEPDGTTPVANWNGLTFSAQLQKRVGDAWVDMETAVATQSAPVFTFNFSTETYTEAGVYAYQVLEIADPAQKILYDSVLHTFSVTVADTDMDGKLEIVRVHSDHTNKDFDKIGGVWTIPTGFTNIKENIVPATVSINIQKELTNNSNSPLVNLSGYTFGIYTDSACTTALTADGTKIVSIDSPATDTVGESRINIIIGEVGDYTFYVKEIAGSVNNMSYADKVVKVDVKATLDGDKIVATVTYNDTTNASGELVFTNKYEPTEASITLDVRKTLTGRDLAAGEFSFNLSGNGVNETVTNNADGKVVFSALTFNKVGEYYYDVKETSVDANGVTTDKTVRRIKVTVVDNNGVLSASYVVESTAEDYIVFNNTYKAASVKYTIGGNKVLTGKELLNAEFKFTLAASDANGNVAAGAQSHTVENRLDGSFSFPEIEYTAAGDYYYVVTEVNDSAIPGVKYDTTKYIVKITVKDNLKGQLVVETPVIHIAGNGTADKITFTNVYTPAPVSEDITGNKVYQTKINGEVVNKDFGANAFTFNIYESNSAWSENGKLIETVYNDANGKFSFKTLEFTTAGEYYYIVKELHGGQTINGVVYDDNIFRIKIEVKDDGNGKLFTVVHITDKNGVPRDSIEFSNNYVITESAEIILTGVKILKNLNIAADMFEFALFKADENKNITDTTPIEVVKNNATGEFTFSKLIFDGQNGHRGAGVYYFIVKEVNGARGGVTYDTQQYFIKITVTDNNSVLSATVEGADNIVFTNVYNAEPAKVTVKAKKELTGKTLAAGEFSFVIAEVGGSYTETVKNAADGSIAFSELTFDKVGIYTYTVSEVIGFAGGIKYDETKYTVTITVTDDGNGKLSANVDGATNILFKNSYNTENTEVKFSGTKQLLGRNLVAGEFEFILEGEGISQTVKVNADGSFAFNAIAYDKAGTYKYTVKEIKGSVAGVTYDEKVYEITVEVTDNGEGKLVTKVTGADSITFTNKYKATAAEIIFSGKKELTGRPLKAGEFSFKLSGNGVNETVYNDEHGNFVFHTVNYDTAGTYIYTISEVKGDLGGVTYDTNTYTLTVNVTDDGAGKLVAKILETAPVVFKNTYVAQKATIQISGQKVLTGRDLAAGEFSFTIVGATDGINKIVANDANGNFVFPAIEYATAGTYTYTVFEVKGLLLGIKYDETIYTVTVKVSDDGNGKLVAEISGANNILFNNSYNTESTEVRFSGTKKLNGRNLIAGEFEFILEGEGVSRTVKVNADGSFAFDTITYAKAGTYKYTIKEIKGNTAGITYDDTVYNITVEITDDGKGKLMTQVTGADAIVFENTYIASAYSDEIVGTKVLVGRKLKAGEFQFVLKNSNDEIIQTVSNDADGKFSFAKIYYTSAGVYEYTVSEVNNNIRGISYDRSVYRITVIATDNGDGTLTTIMTGAANIVFTNRHRSQTAEVTFLGHKNLLGRELKDGEFTFVLTNSIGTVLEEITNDKNGNFAFSTLKFNGQGTYIFYISEKIGSEFGMHYDSTIYQIYVNVTSDGNGNLVAETRGAHNIDFTNVYAVPTFLTFTGTKLLKGKELNEGEFSFELKDINGNVIETVTNTADGRFAFSTIEYDSEGIYYYTVSELLGNDATILYDTTVYPITVKVIDNGSGKLVATVESDNLVFTNRALAPATVTFEGTNFLDLVLTSGFNFVMKEGENVIANATSDENGRLNFGTLVYDREGTYTYTISEIAGNDEDIIYDANVFTVTVTVTLEGTEFKADVKVDALIPLESAKLSRSNVTTTGIEFYNWTVPEETTEVPEETTVAHEETTEAPEETTEVPEETTKVPEGTTEIPEDSTETPNPETGDGSSTVIWLGAVIIAFCATAGALFSRKREIDNE